MNQTVFWRRLAVLICTPLVMAQVTGCAIPRGSQPFSADRVSSTAYAGPAASAIKIHVTQQAHNLRTPWQKLAPSNSFGLGVLLEGEKVLATANLVQNAQFIEIERPNDGSRSLARVLFVDYEANLALLAPAVSNPEFFKGLVPIRVMPVVKEGSSLDVWQMSRGGGFSTAAMVVSKVYVGRYLTPNSSFLIIQANGILRPEINSVTLPVVQDGQLAGLLLGYDARNQSASIIPGAIISQFLQDAADGKYQGFPTLGLVVHQTIDPHFRSYLGLESGTGGVLVGSVDKGTSAQSLGIEVGDVLVKVDGQQVDKLGNIRDAVYGSIHFSNLLSGEHFVGDRVKVEVLRNGKLLDLQGPLVRKDIAEQLVPELVGSEGPNYLIHGGLVFQELTLAYLSSFGDDWANSAPLGLAQVAREPAAVERQGLRRVVFLAGVLPTSGTQGYESLFGLRVTRVNGVIVKDLQGLQKAMVSPANGMQKIEFDEVPRVIYLDEAQAQIDNRKLQSSDFKIAQLSRISANP
jgi:S1-C subfamily serine protease